MNRESVVDKEISSTTGKDHAIHGRGQSVDDFAVGYDEDAAVAVVAVADKNADFDYDEGSEREIRSHGICHPPPPPSLPTAASPIFPRLRS